MVLHFGSRFFFQLEQWYHPERIFANAIILAAGRDDVPAEQMRKHKEYLCQKYHARIQLIDMQQIEISSHEIREMIAQGHSVDEMLPQAVCSLHSRAAIVPGSGAGQERKLEMQQQIQEIQSKLSKKLSEKRFTHTIGVLYTAEALAMRYGEDLDKAAYAAVLHDCAKILQWRADASKVP